MVLVLLGTQANEFKRLLQEVEKLIDKGIIKDEVIVQKGSTKYESSKFKSFDLLSREQIEEIKEKADLVITHGGVGSITSSIKLGKKIISVPRREKYGEHINDHQVQIVENFDKMGYIKGIKNVEDLEEAIKQIDKFKPRKYISNTENMIKIIEDYIENN